jgi:hypothetical protein
MDSRFFKLLSQLHDSVGCYHSLKDARKSQIHLGSPVDHQLGKMRRAGANRGFVQPAEKRGECDKEWLGTIDL